MVTVKELIEQLQGLDPQLPVYIANDSFGAIRINGVDSSPFEKPMGHFAEPVAESDVGIVYEEDEIAYGALLW